jgi:hypothetical protein
VANEVLSDSTSLGNLVVDKGQTKTRYERMGLYNPIWANTKMRTFGEAGVVKRDKNDKLGDQGIPMMFVGYPINHASDSYQMYNPKTSKISEVRDVIWLKRMFYQDDINADTAMLPEIRVELTEFNALDEAGQAAAGVCVAGGVNPVLDETEVENELASLASSKSTKSKTSIKSEQDAGNSEDSEAREGG